MHSYLNQSVISESYVLSVRISLIIDVRSNKIRCTISLIYKRSLRSLFKCKKKLEVLTYTLLYTFNISDAYLIHFIIPPFNNLLNGH